MTEFGCPVEGCRFLDERAGSVRGHISASQQAGHAGISGTDFSDDDLRDAAQSGDEGAESGEEDTSASGADTDAEYQRQRDLATGGADSDEDPAQTPDDSAQMTPETGQTSAASGSFLPPVDTRTIIVIVALVGIAVTAYLVLSSDSEDDEDESEALPEADEEAPQNSENSGAENNTFAVREMEQ